MSNKFKTFTNGLLKENPLLILNIGLCSSLGITTNMFNGLGMGLGMMFVLIMSELFISLLRKQIPDSIRLPVFIIIIAAFTTIVQLVLQAYVPSLYDALGVFLPLIVVNCIIMTAPSILMQCVLALQNELYILQPIVRFTLPVSYLKVLPTFAKRRAA